MISKLFTKKFLTLSLVSLISLVAFNIYKNEFGLLGDDKSKNIRIYASEKTSKYLLSFNYIPNNFNGILVGPSLSDQMMDTKKLSNRYDIYNLSMDSGNISELKYAIDNVLKYGDIKLFVLCLDPYITKDSGTKSSQINPKEYYSTFGSIFNFKFYLKKVLNNRQGSKSIFHDSYWGYTDHEYRKRDVNSTQRIDKSLREIVSNKDYSNSIDRTAYSELEEILSSVRERGIQIVSYYYPRPKRILDHPVYNKSYTRYQKEIEKLFNKQNDIIVDFTQAKYDYIRENDANYSDRIHLTRQGANSVMRVLKQEIDKPQYLSSLN